jgi:hypothetical protein
MPKNNSYVIKAEKICTRRYLEINTCCFHRIAVFANGKALFLRLGSSVHHFEHVIKQETHIFTKMIIIITKFS